MITGVGCSWSDNMAKKWTHLLICEAWCLHTRVQGFGFLFSVGVLAYRWTRQPAPSVAAWNFLEPRKRVCLLWSSFFFKFYFFPESIFWGMNAHFLVQYTGRLLTNREQGEIFQNLDSFIPFSNSGAWAGGSFACVKWKPETFHLLRYWLIYLWPLSQANVEGLFLFCCPPPTRPPPQPLPPNLQVQRRSVFEGCRSRTSHWLALKRVSGPPKLPYSVHSFHLFWGGLTHVCFFAAEVSWSPGSPFSSEC